MKKTFNLTSPNKEPERQVDSVVHEIRKYVKRERRKPLPENVDFWDFDCRIGNDVDSATDFKLDTLNASIDKFVQADKETFYLEILAKPGHAENKNKKK
ncbi:MAG: hypothetical protein KC493_12230 [Bacteriovoracaceae bacterium]|nr:hypothetical protein [Bacteriovoracaceae bacterium]